MKRLVITIILLTTITFSFAQERTLKALRIDEKAKIDGVLDEVFWSNCDQADKFVELFPEFGKEEPHGTIVKIAYSDDAIYVGALMKDPEPEKIMKSLSTRDSGEGGNADIFSFTVDTFNDDLNAFSFWVSSSGVQTDIRFTSNGVEVVWDAVWNSAVKITSEGWVAEMEIPYSAIRFPKRPVQDWGINFDRIVRKTRGTYSWSSIDPEIPGRVNQFGNLTGVENINPPLRLSITPFITAYRESRPNENGKGRDSDYFVNGGMDLKLGLNESYTLDMTLIPDFGQVESDDIVFNLSPFEVRFDEKRPFFTEGIDLFRRASLFYSRRIGGRPDSYYDVEDDLLDGESIQSNPDRVQLYNAAKITGRNKKGLAIGVFNAIAGNATATIVNDSTGNEREFRTESATNYNILVFDQTLPNNSYMSFINTNVIRANGERDANVTGLEFVVNNKKNNFRIYGEAALSQIFEKEENFNAYDVTVGHKYFLRMGKNSGNFNINYFQNVESDTYDQNDLGILFANNEFTNGLQLRYSIFKPFGPFNRANFYLNSVVEQRFDTKDFVELGHYFGGYFGLKSFDGFGFNGALKPLGVNDYFEPRKEGIYREKPAIYSMNPWFSSNYNRTLAFDLWADYVIQKDLPEKNYAVGFSPRWRVNDKLLIIAEMNHFRNKNEWDYADELDDETILYGERDIKTFENLLTAEYLFTNRMSLSFRARHYWSRGEYSGRFFNLNESTHLLEDYTYTDVDNELDFNFNTFNIDLVYSWEFSRGSSLNLVYKNILLDAFSVDKPQYFENLSQTFKEDHFDSVSIKFLYFLDYNKIKKMKKFKGNKNA